jgi:hypothetical protein
MGKLKEREKKRMPRTSSISPEIRKIFRLAIEFVIERGIKSNTLMSHVAKNLKRPPSPRNDSSTKATKAVVQYVRAFNKAQKPKGDYGPKEAIQDMFHTAITSSITGVGNCHESSCLVFAKAFQILFREYVNNVEQDIQTKMDPYVFVYCEGIKFDHGFSLLLTKAAFETLIETDDDVPFTLKDLKNDDEIMVIDPWFESVSRQSGNLKKEFDLHTLTQAVENMGPNDGTFDIDDDWEIPEILTQENVQIFNHVIQSVPSALAQWGGSDKSSLFTLKLADEAILNKKAEPLRTDGRSLSPITTKNSADKTKKS